MASPETPFNHDHADWLGSPEEPLKGFTSYERDVGVLMWSDVFLHDGPEGEKYAIIIAVTKGIPDADSNENSMFFFLSSVVASVQLFNLRGSLEQKHFDRISVAAKFGEDALKHGVKDEPFGKLTFLIRSSIDPHYGYDAGVKSFEKYWAAEDKQTAEYTDFLKNLDHSFKGFACFQFISPGPKVFEAGFDGRKSQLDQIYLEQIKFIVEDIFDVTEKEVKLIHGEQLEVSKYYAYLKKYAEIMKDDKTVKFVTAFFDVKI